MAFCPNLSNKEVKKQFDTLVSVLGENVAYAVYDANKGHFLDKTKEGKESYLFTDLMNETGDEKEAIRSKALIYSDVFNEYMINNVRPLGGLEPTYGELKKYFKVENLFSKIKNREKQESYWAAKSEVERLLGVIPASNTFLKKDLGMTHLAYGMLMEKAIYLSELDSGMVRSTVARHEAFHYVAIHMLDENRYKEVIKAAEKIMRKEGYDFFGNIENEVNEWLAEKFEDKSYKPSTLIGRFIQWMRDIVNKLAGARNTINTLFKEVDEGKFANAAANNVNSDIEVFKKTIDNEYNSGENFDETVKIFGGLDTFYSVRERRVAKAWTETSPFGRNIAITSMNWHKQLKEIERLFADDFRRNADQDVSIIVNNQIVFNDAVDKMTPDHYRLAVANQFGNSISENRTAMEQYENYHIAIDQSHFLVMLQSIFKAVDIETMWNNPTADAFGISGKTSYEKSNEESNPLDGESDLFKLVLGSIQLYSAKTKELIPNKSIDFVALDKVLIDTMLSIRQDGAPITFEQIIIALEEYQKNVVDTRLRNIIYSFIKEFGTQGYPELITKRISGEEVQTIENDGLYNIANNEFILEDLQESDPEVDKEAVKAKVKNFQDVIAAITRHYASLTTSMYTLVDWRAPKPYLIELQSFDPKIMKDEVQKRSNNKLIMQGLLDPYVVKDIHPESETRRFDIDIKNRTINLRVLKDLKVERVETIYGNNAISITDARKVLDFLGMTQINVEVLRTLEAASKDSWERFSVNLFDMLHSVKIASEITQIVRDARKERDSIIKPWKEDLVDNYKMVERNFDKKESKAKKTEFYKAHIKRIESLGPIDIKFSSSLVKEFDDFLKLMNKLHKRRHAYGNKTLAQIKQEIGLNNDSTPIMIPLPSDMWGYIEEELSEAVVKTANHLTSRVVKNAEGDNTYVHPLSSFFFDLFPSMYDGSELYARKLRADLNDVESSVLINENSTEKNPIYNNAILNKKIQFDYIFRLNGLIGMNKGVKAKNLTSFDMIMNYFEGVLIPTISSQESIRKVAAYHDTLSDKATVPLVQWFINERSSQGDSKESLMKSYKKGNKNLSNAFRSFKIKEDMVLSILTDISNYYKAYVEQAKSDWNELSKMNPTVEQAMASKYELNNVYRIEGTKVLPGKVVLQTTDATSEFFNPYLVFNSNMSYEDTRKLFEAQFSDLGSVLDEKGYQVPGEFNKTQWSDNEGNVKEGYIDTETGEWHPLLEVGFWSHLLFNESISHLVRGPAISYGKNMDNVVIDFVKRASGLIAPGTSFNTQESWSLLPEKSRALILDDMLTENSEYNAAVEATDGAVMIMPWYHQYLVNDHGGRLGHVGNAAIKTVNFNYDPITGKKSYLKMAMFNTPESRFVNSPYLQRMLKMALGEVGSMKVDYENNISDDEALLTWYDRFMIDYTRTTNEFIDWLRTEEGSEYKSKLVDYVVYKTAIKSGATNIQKSHGDYETAISDNNLSDEEFNALNSDDHVRFIPNSTLRLQTITHQETVDQKKNIAIQLTYLIAAGDFNNALAKMMNDSFKNMSDVTLKKLLSNDTIEEKITHLKEVGYSKLAKSEQGYKMLELLDKTSGADLNIIRMKAFQMFASDITDSVKPKMSGQNYIQAPSYEEIYWYKGTPMTKNEALLGLYIDNKGNLQEGVTKKPLGVMSYEGDVFTPAQVIMPFNAANQFGIEKGQTLMSSMTIEVNGENLYFYDKSYKEIYDEFEKLKDVNLNTVVAGMSEPQRKVIRDYVSKNEVSLGEALRTYFIEYNKALEVISVRIPTGEASAAAFAKIVAFDWESENTVYINPQMNILNGADFDIDALAIFFREYNNNLNSTAGIEMKNKNVVFDSIAQFYQSVENKERVLSLIDLTTFRERVEKYENSEEDVIKKKLYPNTLGTYFRTIDSGWAGTHLVGHFANIQNFLFRMLSLPLDERKNLYPNIELLRNDDLIFYAGALLNKFINAATDNANEGGLLGRLNVNAVTTPLIAGMILEGYTEDQIFDVLLDDETVKTTNNVLKTNTFLRASTGENDFKYEKNSKLKKSRKSTFSSATNNPVLKSIAERGEYVSGLRSVFGLLKEMPSSAEALEVRIGQVSLSLGMHLTEFLDGLSDANTDWAAIRNSSDFINTSPFVKKGQGDKIRKTANELKLAELLSNPIFGNIVTLLDILDEMREYNNEIFYPYKHIEVRNEFLKLTGQNGLVYEDTIVEFNKEFDKALLGSYISSLSEVNYTGGIYDMNTFKGRMGYVSSFPDYVKRLKESDLDNPFINRLTEKEMNNTGINRVELINSTAMDQNEKAAYSLSFSELDEEIKSAFRLYQALIFGFAYSKGTMIEVLDTQFEIDYSTWLSNNEGFITSNAEMIAQNIILVGNGLVPNNIRTAKGSDAINPFYDLKNTNGAKFTNTEEDQSKTKNIVRLDEKDGVIVPTRVSALQHTHFNSYLDHDMLFDGIQYSNVKPATKNDLVNGKDASLVIIGKSPFKEVQNKWDEGFNIYDGDIVTIDEHLQVEVDVTSPKSVVLKSPFKLESRVTMKNHAVSGRTLSFLLDRFQKSFPNIKINLVTNNDMISNKFGIAGFIQGQLFINVDKAQTDTLAHEFIGHVFVDILEVSNNNDYQKLKAEALTLTKEISLIKENYPGRSHDMIIKEVIANMIGWESVDSVEDYLNKNGFNTQNNQALTLWDKIKRAVRRLQSIITNLIRDSFGTPKFFEGYNTNSIKELAQEAVKAVLDGELVSTISSDAFYELSEGANYEARITNVKNVSEFINLLDSPFTTEIKISRVKDILRERKTPTGEYILDSWYVGEKVVFTGDLNSKSNESKIKDLIKRHENRSNNYADVLIDFLINKNGNIEEGEALFNGTVTASTLNKFKDRIQHFTTPNRKGRRYIRYSDIATIPELKHLYFSDLVSDSFNPLVEVITNSNGKIAVSLYDIKQSGKESFVKDRRNNGILKNYFAKTSSQRTLGIELYNTGRDIRKLMLGVLYTRMMQVDSNFNVLDVATIDMGKHGLQYRTVDPASMRSTLEGIAKVDELMADIKSSDIKKAFTDNKRDAHIDWFDVLETLNHEAPPVSDVFDKLMPAKFSEGNLSNQEKIFILERRLKEVNANLSNPRNKREQRILVEAMAALKLVARKDNQSNSYQMMDKGVRMVYDGHSIGDNNVQRMRELMQDASFKIVKRQNIQKKKLEAMYKIMEKEYRKHNFIGRNILSEASWAVWDPLFYKENTSDTGVEFNTGFVFWTLDSNKVRDMKDSSFQLKMIAKAKQLISEGKLTKEMVEVGKQLTEMTEEFLRKGIYLSKINNVNSNDFWNFDKKRRLEENDIDPFTDSQYTRGMTPLMPAKYAEQVSKGKVGAALKSGREELVDHYELHGFDMKENSDSNKEFETIVDGFLFQFGIDQQEGFKTQYGSNTRTFSMLGLNVTSDKNGNPITELQDQGKNDALSMNMNKIMDFFTMTVLRKEEYESSVLPMINAMIQLLDDITENNLTPEEAKSLKESKAYLEDAARLGIKGERKEDGYNLFNLNVEKSASLIMKVSSAAVMTANLNVGAVGAISNAMFAHIEGLTNWFVENGIFNSKDLVKANKAMITDYKKVKALMKYLQVHNMTEYDMLHHYVQRKENKTAFNQFTATWTNWAVDNVSRGIVMTAQMMHDGVWDAFEFDKTTGDIKYDEKKDPRFFDEKGKQSNEQKGFYKNFKEILINDGVWGQEDNKPLVSGYDRALAVKAKAVADKWSVGAYDSQTKWMIANNTLGAALSQFLQWIAARYTNAFGKAGYLESFGNYKTHQDKNSGEWITEWEALQYEGYLTTFYSYFSALVTGNRKYYDVTNSRKANFYKVGITASMYLFSRLLYAALVEGDSPDDDKWKKDAGWTSVIPNARLTKNFKYAANSIWVMPNMFALIERPVPSWSIMKGYFIDPMSKEFRLDYPGRTSIKTVRELFDEDL